MLKMAKKVVITDLDYTLLNENYEFAPAVDALELLKQKKIPVILCTSKTFSETVYFAEKIGLKDPFIVENGGAFYIPEEFALNWNLNLALEKSGGFYFKNLGVKVDELEKFLKDFRKKFPGRIKTYQEMKKDDLMKITNLPEPLLEYSLQRQFDLPFLIEGNGELLRELEIEVRKRDLKLQRGGIFYHLSGSHTKADALEELFRVLGNSFIKAKKIGLGDSPNDLEMLQWVDVPVVIAKPGVGYDKILIENLENPLLPEGTGPIAWGKAIFDILGEGG